MPLLIGNDIVDLTHSDTQATNIHPRFMERVCHPQEITFLQNTTKEKQTRLLWTYWATKEAAYKALKRHHLDLIFRPQQLYFDYPTHKLHYANTYELDCQLEEKETYVHVIATFSKKQSIGGNDNVIQYAIYDKKELPIMNTKPQPSDSRLVRQLLQNDLAQYLQLPFTAIEITKRKVSQNSRIPYVLINEQEAGILLSLSHHGNYLAYAFIDFIK